MIKKRLRKSFLLGALFAVLLGSTLSAATATWTGGDPAKTYANSISAYNGVGGITALDLVGNKPILINGIVTIGAFHGTPLDVNVKRDNVTFKPDPNGTGDAVLVFFADVNNSIVVNCDHDITFTGDYANGYDMIVSFSGQGTTTFKLTDYNTTTTPGTPGAQRGANIVFTGSSVGLPGKTVNQAGTKVYVTMDQTAAQAMTTGINKVVFQRAESSHAGYPTGVIVGPGSFITYLSNNASGLDGYGSIAFDPTRAFDSTTTGTGRMFLEVKGDSFGQLNYHDGAVIIAGCYASSLDPVVAFGIDPGTSLDLGVAGGCRALFRIIDNQRNQVDPKTAAGLLIINGNTTIARMASDPYYEYGLVELESEDPLKYGPFWATDYSWYYSWFNRGLNTRTGFVVGVNGEVDVFHKTFMDYVALGTNKLDIFANEDFTRYMQASLTTSAAAAYMKLKNPAALLFDGINPAEIDYFTCASVGGPDYSTNPARPRVVLHGDAKLLARCAQDAQGVNPAWGPYFDDSNDLVYSFTIDKGPYTGQYIDSVHDTITIGEGNHVIDIEGDLLVTSTVRKAPGSIRYTDAFDVDMGTINMPTIAIDYKGEEYDPATGEAVTRALTLDADYMIYNSPAIFVNSPCHFVNTIINHNDVTKDTTPNPALAEPAITGGERKYFQEWMWEPYYFNTTYYAIPADLGWQPFYEYPTISLTDCDIDLHESLVYSGVRFSVSDLFYDNVIPNKNTSGIYFYDHGDQLDTLLKQYGRSFVAGSMFNKMADGSTNYVVESAFVNVYRNNKTVGDAIPAGPIELSVNENNDENTGLNPEQEKAMHLFMLSRPDYGTANMSLGWTTTFGVQSDRGTTIYAPWQEVPGLGSQEFNIGTGEFIVASDTPSASVTPATLSVNADNIYFGGLDKNNAKSLIPVTTSNDSGVIYTNHGGKFSTAQPIYEGYADWDVDGYNCFIDTQVGTLLWRNDVAPYELNGLAGVNDLVHDQTIFGKSFGIQPYNVNTTLYHDPEATAPVRLNVYNYDGTVSPDGRKYYDRDGAEEYTIAWAHRAYDEAFVPVKALDIPTRKDLTRYTATLTEPYVLPNDLMYVTADADGADYIKQLKVQGATQADPLNLLVSGDPNGHNYAAIDEIVSIPSQPAPGVYGEGAHAVIFIDNNGHVGLGSMGWNEDSATRAWNVLGKDYVTISPNGNGVVIVNSDLIVADKLPLVPTENFGQEEKQRITFYSDDVKEIRIPAGGELDLSAFGRAIDGNYDEYYYGQEIEFGGKVRLVFEKGSTLRFPDLSALIEAGYDASWFPVLYMNDETELVFEGQVNYGEGRYEDIDSADAEKIKILGCGQIWVNKDASLKIFDTAKVAVRSDEQTLFTDILLSAQRDAQILLGDENNAGGSLEVGNIASSDDRSPAYPVVNFRIKLNDRATFRIDREGFLGLGVGIINKTDNPNGYAVQGNNPVVTEEGELEWNPDTEAAWQVQSLYDTHKIDIQVLGGSFDHSNIYNGQYLNSSLIAFGALYSTEEEDGSCTIVTNKTGDGTVYAGGNVMYLEPSLVEDEPGMAYVNAWDYADFDLRSTDSTMYNISAPSVVINRPEIDSTNFYSATITEAPTTRTFEATDFYGLYDAFVYLSQPDKNASDYAVKNVPVGQTNTVTKVGYVYNITDPEEVENGINIYRVYNPIVTGGLITEAVDLGFVGMDQDFGRGKVSFALPKITQR